MLFTLLAISWFGLGASGFIYWYTKDYDFNLEQTPIALAVSFMGPLSWSLGWMIHGDHSGPSLTLIKKRQ